MKKYLGKILLLTVGLLVGAYLTFPAFADTIHSLPRTVLLQTNGVTNGSQTLLNLIAGTLVNLTDDGLGGVTIDITAGTDYTYTYNGAAWSMYAGKNITAFNNDAIDSTVTGNYTNPLEFQKLNRTILMGNDAGANVNWILNGTADVTYVGVGAGFSDISTGNNVGIGNGALYYNTGSNNTAVGIGSGIGGAAQINFSAQSSYFGDVSGQNQDATNYDSIANNFFGSNSGVKTAAASITGSTVIGAQAFATDNYQFVLGGSVAGFNTITDGYFGSGVYNYFGGATDFTMHATGGDINTADANGLNLHFAGGIATGAGVGGSFTWQTSDAGGSGITPQTLSNKMELAVDGQLRLNTYGLGTYSGSLAKGLGVDSSGNVIEYAPGVGSITDITLTQPAAGLTVTGSGTPCTTSCSFTFALANDLATLESLTATTDNFIVSVASAWASRTPAQVKTTLSLNNVENTALSTWAGSTNLTTLGTIGTGTWQGSLVTGQYGGTGVANTGKTITLAANFATSGANALTLTTTGVTNVTLPTTGELDTIDTAKTISGVKTFLDQTIKLRNPANTFSYTLVHGAIAADRTLNVPVITATDTLAVLGLAQTFTGANTHSGLNAMLVSSSGLTVRNPANTFKYTVTAGAIAADRTLNLPVITGTDTVAVLGLAQTFSQNQTFSGDIIKGSFTAGGNNISTAQQAVFGISNTNTQQYRTTNAGSDIALKMLVTTSLTSAGTHSYIFDPANTGVIAFGAANGTRQIARAGIGLTNLVNTAGSESGDLIFYTQAAGAAMTEKLGITSGGNLTLFNPAGTFRYTIVPAAIAAARTLNLPLTTGTDTLATLGLAQTFSATQTFSANIIASGATSVIRLKGYTVATLPAGTTGDTAYVTDALAPTFLAVIVGGGAVVTPVFYNGTNWVGY